MCISIKLCSHSTPMQHRHSIPSNSPTNDHAMYPVSAMKSGRYGPCTKTNKLLFLCCICSNLSLKWLSDYNSYCTVLRFSIPRAFLYPTQNLARSRVSKQWGKSHLNKSISTNMCVLGKLKFHVFCARNFVVINQIRNCVDFSGSLVHCGASMEFTPECTVISLFEKWNESKRIIFMSYTNGNLCTFHLCINLPCSWRCARMYLTDQQK